MTWAACKPLNRSDTKTEEGCRLHCAPDMASKPVADSVAEEPFADILVLVASSLMPSEESVIFEPTLLSIVISPLVLSTRTIRCPS